MKGNIMHENNKQPILPITISPNIIIDGEKYLEILDTDIPNVMPGQYLSINGNIYDSYTDRIRHPSDGVYLMTYIKLKDGSNYHTGVHRLIMLVFSNRPSNFNELVINHKDGNKHNNDLNNLEWATYSENNIHAFKTGLNPVGEDHHCAKLTNSQVEEICKELEKPRYYGQLMELGNKYGVGETDIQRIANGKIWTNISKKYNIDYNMKGIDSILTEDQVKEICEELSKGRYHGQCTKLGKKYNVSPSTIKEIVQRRSWTSISKDYEFPSSINTKLSEDTIHDICKLIQKYGYCDINVKKEIAEKLNLEYNDRLRHNIGRLYRRDKHCYYDITSQYKW
jgi:transposase